MEIGEMLLQELPGSIDRNGKVISSLLANENKTGAVEKEMSNWYEYSRSYIDSPSVYSQSGDLLDKTVKFFSEFTRIYGETDENLKKRISALFIRNHDDSWGTISNIKNVFKSFFSQDEIYLIESTNDLEDNLIEDPEFSLQDESWSLINCEYSRDARFSKSHGIKFSSNGKLSQQIELEPAKTYFVHWFMKGTVRIEIKNVTKNKYWNYKTRAWQNTSVVHEFTESEWNNNSEWFMLENDASDNNVQIVFYGDSGSCIDYTMLFLKGNYHSFTVFIHFEGNNTGERLVLAEGQEDAQGTAKSHWQYYDDTYITGPNTGFTKETFEKLLEYVRSVGVKSYVEYIMQDV